MKRRPAILLSLALLFGVLGTLVEMNDDGPVLLDTPILTSLEDARTPGGIAFVEVGTDLGGHEVMIPLCTILVLFVAWKSRRSGAFMALALGGSAGLNELVKNIFARPRPTVVERLTNPRGLSFPSGHSQSSMAFALAIFFVLWRLEPRWRKPAFALFAFPLFIGFTRAYLGVHYPTDILGGWILATFWVVLVDAWYVRVDVSVTRGAGSAASSGDGAEP